MKEPLIKVENFNFKYRNADILRDINLEINRGEFVVIIGPRGEGKSTFLKTLAGLISIEEGNMFYGDINLLTAQKKEIMSIQRKTAFVFQDSALISNMKVFDNIALPLRYNEIYPEEEINKIVQEKLEYVNLQNIGSILPAFISTGQRRLIALLRAIVVNPETIFYDEPFIGLDRPSQQIAVKIIQDTIKKKVTSVFVSHEWKCIEKFIDKIVVLRNRTIYKVGTLQQIKNSNDEFINSLIE
ncbi:MAG: ATP-binding cassette domain-containing protein [Spirochaetes bacterium]|nr:ATP-binding cassette domain-containing protein [Spirochaetota bacterium]